MSRRNSPICPRGKGKFFFSRYIPANEFFRGLKLAAYQGRAGRQTSYLLGQVYNGGRWYFFPVAILVKTQIPMLLLLLAGTVWVFLSRELRWEQAIRIPHCRRSSVHSRSAWQGP